MDKDLIKRPILLTNRIFIICLTICGVAALWFNPFLGAGELVLTAVSYVFYRRARLYKRLKLGRAIEKLSISRRGDDAAQYA